MFFLTPSLLRVQVGYAFQTRKGDIAGALVIAWTLCESTCRPPSLAATTDEARPIA